MSFHVRISDYTNLFSFVYFCCYIALANYCLWEKDGLHIRLENICYTTWILFKERYCIKYVICTVARSKYIYVQRKSLTLILEARVNNEGRVFNSSIVTYCMMTELNFEVTFCLFSAYVKYIALVSIACS